MRNLTVLLLLLLVVGAQAQPRYLERADGTFITYYLDRPEAESFPVLAYLQGSECLRVSHKYSEEIERLTHSGIAVLRVEKPGLNASVRIGECPEEYLRLNTPQRRVLDLLMVLAEIRRQESGFNGSVGLLGGSEGAMIAGMSAPMVPDLKALVLISAGGGTTFGEAVLGSIRQHMEGSGMKGEVLETALAGVRRETTQMMSEPVINKEWASDGELVRCTYKWWASAWNLKLSTPLMSVDSPILAIHGNHDRNIAVACASLLESRLLEAGKENFELRTYDGGHAPTEEAMSEALDWVVARLSSERG